MNSVCGEYFDWLVNEREPYPESLNKELDLTAETGRNCSVIRGPILSIPKSSERKECVSNGQKE